MDHKEAMKLEENSMFQALYGEVVAVDSYGLQNLLFAPDLILDIGANIGVFAKHVSELYPSARIVCVEPDAVNFDVLSSWASSYPNITLLNEALGRGKVWRVKDVPNGSHEHYLGQYLGFPDGHHDRKVETGDSVLTSLEAITIEDLFEDYWKPGLKTLVKIDCEGAENSIFDHEPSMRCLRRAEYVTMEIHVAGVDRKAMTKASQIALSTFESTHDCWQFHAVFSAAKHGLAKETQAYSGPGLSDSLDCQWAGWVLPD